METYQSTFTIKRLWIILGTSLVVMFGVLLLLGREISADPKRCSHNVRRADLHQG